MQKKNNECTDLLFEPWLHERWTRGGPSLYKEKRFEEVITLCDRVIACDPTCVLAYIHKGRALSSLEKEIEAEATYQQALAVAQNNLRLYPHKAEAWFHVGDALFFHHGKVKEALEAYDQAIQLDPPYVDAYVHKGYLLYRETRVEALDAFDQALELTPNDADIYGKKGTVLWEMRRYEEAIECYDRAIQLQPHSMKYYRMKCSTLLYMGKSEESKKLLQYIHNIEEGKTT